MGGLYPRGEGGGKTASLTVLLFYLQAINRGNGEHLEGGKVLSKQCSTLGHYFPLEGRDQLVVFRPGDNGGDGEHAGGEVSSENNIPLEPSSIISAVELAVFRSGDYRGDEQHAGGDGASL